jgi:hypothetical protein
MVRKADFNPDVPLPPGLTITAIQKAIDYIEKGLTDLIEIYLEQANIFSALVGIYGANFDHSGWYIVWRYLVDPTMSLEEGKPVIIWRIDVVFLTKGDWKYEGSSAGSAGGGRTHTFGLKNPAQKLKSKAVYQRKDVRLLGGKAVPANGD